MAASVADNAWNYRGGFSAIERELEEQDNTGFFALKREAGGVLMPPIQRARHRFSQNRHDDTSISHPLFNSRNVENYVCNSFN